MKIPKLPIRSLVCFLALSPLSAAAGEEPSSENDSAAEAVTIDGVFEPIKAHEITADVEELKSLEIQRIVPHGIEVKKDQNLVSFETEEIDQQIEDAQAQLRLAELDLQDAEFAHEQFLESQKLDRAAADRTLKKAKQAYDNFVQVDRERQIETANHNLTNAKASLENAMEELEQLEQMYQEDDLTEESEEIVLKRAKQAVENAKFRFRNTEIATQRSLKQSIPRAQAEQEATLTRAQLAHAKAVRDLNSERTRRDIELRKKRNQVDRQQSDFKQLQDERKKLVIQAPAAGIVVHGKLTRGKISDKPSTLEAGSSVTGDQVLMTLFEPGRLQIRVDLEQTDLPAARPGAEGIVTIAAYPDLKLGATVTSVSLVPFAGSKFDGVLSVKLLGDTPPIVPGMTCKIGFAATDAVEKTENDENVEGKDAQKQEGQDGSGKEENGVKKED